MKTMRPAPHPRVLMVLSYFHPFRGGAENQALLLSETLRQRGLEVAVLTRAFNQFPDFETIGSVPVYRQIQTVNARTLFGLWYFISCIFFMIVQRKHYDILHCHIVQGFHSIAAVIVGRLFKKKVVIKIANTGVSSDFIHARRVLAGGYILRFLRKTDRLIATSRQSAIEAHRQGFSDAQITMIPNGVDTRRFKPSGRSEHSRSRIICVGRLVKVKGIDVLIDAFSQLKREGTCGHLDIVGAGPEHDTLLKKAVDMGCAEEVIFHGEVADVESFFDTSCVFVQPSLAEGMSNVLLEAMACGLPVVATRAGAATDIIQDSVNGLLVDTGSAGGIRDAVRKIVCDEEFAQALGSNARKTVADTCSIDIIARQYMELYRELIAS
jgi:glycosyltransferase involved in cell wall biosynthesis